MSSNDVLPLANDDLKPFRLTQWSRRHAVILLIGAGSALLEGSPLLMILMILASFLGLIQILLHGMKGKRKLGYANALSCCRIAGSLALLASPSLEHGLLTLAALALLGLDGLDGWLARRLGETSMEGALLDLEADALLVLVLCLLLSSQNPPGLWILAPGLFRPLFVLSDRPDSATSQQSGTRFTRAIGTLSPLVLALLLLPDFPEQLVMPLAVGTTTMLAASFLYSSVLRLRKPGCLLP